MHLYVQSLIQGLIFGSIYGIAALGFGLIYTTTRIFHIAFGAFAIFGTYIVAEIALSNAAMLAPAILAGASITAALTAMAYTGVYRWMERRGANAGAIFVASLGLALVTEAVIVIVFGPATKLFQYSSFFAAKDIGGYQISYLGAVSIGVGLISAVLVTRALKRTVWGYRVTGISSNRQQAELVGVHVGPVVLQAWLLAAALSIAAELLLAMNTSLTSSGGTELTLVASIAVIAGGIGNLTGAYGAALLIGEIESLSGAALPGQWATSLVFAAFLVMLLTRPAGIFSRAKVRRA